MSDFSAGTPAGGESTAVSSGTPAVGGAPAPAPSAPTVLELSDDSMVRLPGQKDPVKYGDYYRSFQSQFTKKAQEAKAAAEARQQLERELQARDQRLQQLERAIQGTQPKPGSDLRAAIANLPYLEGQHAAQLVDFIASREEGFQQALQQRDYALALMTKQLQQLNSVVGQMRERSSAADFGGKISGWVKELGLPDAATDLAKEIYLAYEGDDLDTEFPQILRSRWEQINNLIAEQNRRKADEARNRPFVPGRGGLGSASKPIANLATAKASEIAESLWPGLDGTET